MWLNTEIFLIAVAYRVVNCLLVHTYFHPDEYYQSLEPAHNLAFEYGFLTWEWKRGIRSYLYPMGFAILYRTLSFAHLDYRILVVFSPRLLQSLFGAVADVYFYKFVKLLFGELVAIWTLFSFWLNWFQFYCSPRTLSSTIEMQLLLIGLYFYPWPYKWTFAHNRRRHSNPPHVYLAIAAIGTIIRPTSLIFWIPLSAVNFYRTKAKFIKASIISILPIVFLSILVDRLCYGRWTFTLWNFVEFNFLSGSSAHFGVDPWHWYFTRGLPAICFTHLIFILFGIYKCECRWIACLCFWYVSIHSLIPHKELRFMLPLLPLLNIYIGICLEHYSKMEFSTELWKTLKIENYFQRCSKKSKALLSLLFITNVPIILFSSLLIQTGSLSVPKYINSLALNNNASNIRVWFLTPQYSTPLYCHVHSNINIRILTRDPPLISNSLRSADKGNMFEVDAFHNDPKKWLITEMANLRIGIDRPTHLVVFDYMWMNLREFFEDLGYRKHKNFYNSYITIRGNTSMHFMILYE